MIVQIVVFYKSTEAASKQALKVLRAVSKSGNLPQHLEYIKCDASLPINEADIREAQFSEYPIIFVTSNEGGIQRYTGPIEVSVR